MLTIHKKGKYFLIMRGLPGSGKSTFIEKMFGDKATTICPDELRLHYNGLIQTLYGKRISQANPKFIWDKTYEILEDSLLKNRITILDATSVHEKDLLKGYALVKNTNIHFFVIDFSSVSLDECKARNKVRMPEYKRVSDDVLDRMNKSLIIPLSANCEFKIYSYTDIKVE